MAYTVKELQPFYTKYLYFQGLKSTVFGACMAIVGHTCADNYTAFTMFATCFGMLWIISYSFPPPNFMFHHSDTNLCRSRPSKEFDSKT